MPDTYLRRRWTLARVAETFRDRVPLSVHLFLALAAFYCLTAGRGAPALPERLLGPGFMAATLVLGMLLLGRLGVAPRAAAGWALVAGTGTILWPEARAGWAEPATALLLMGLLFAAQRCREAWSWQRAAVAAAVFLVAAAQRPYLALTAPLWAWFLLTGVRFGRWQQLGISLAAALGGLCLCLALQAVYADGGGQSPGFALLPRLLADLSPWSVPIRVWAALFAPGRSLLLYSPPLLLAVAGLPALGRRDGAVAGLVAALGLLALGFLAVVGGGPGRVAWLDEPMAAVLPVLMLPAAFASLDRRGRLAVLVAVAGVAVQVAAVAVDYRALAGGLVYRRAVVDGTSESWSGADAGPLDPAFDPDVCPLRLAGETLAAWAAGQPKVEFSVLHGAPIVVEIPVGTLGLDLWFLAPGLGARGLLGLAVVLSVLLATGGALRARLGGPA